MGGEGEGLTEVAKFVIFYLNFDKFRFLKCVCLNPVTSFVGYLCRWTTLSDPCVRICYGNDTHAITGSSFIVTAELVQREKLIVFVDTWKSGVNKRCRVLLRAARAR